MLYVEVRESPLGFEVVRVLRQYADQCRIVDRSRKPVCRGETQPRAEPALGAHVGRMGDRRGTGFKLEDVLETLKRTPAIERSPIPCARLIHIHLPPEMSSFLPEV